MENGYIKLYRKILDSRVFQNEKLLKVWVWCLLRATYREQWFPITTGRGETEVHLLPGQFVFGRNTAAKELRMPESSVRNRIAKLKNMRNLDIQKDTHYSIITVVNWEAYQATEKIEDSQQDSQRTASGQPVDTYNKGKKGNNKPPDFFSLKKRYSDQDLIDQVFAAIASTRKCGKVSDSILFAQVRAWEKYPVNQVQDGLSVYLEKNYARVETPVREVTKNTV